MPSGEQHSSWKGGASSYRQRALRHYGEQCTNKRCLIRKVGIRVPTYMLDVDHINGDHSNHALENLQVLCVWCHTEKTRRKRCKK